MATSFFSTTTSSTNLPFDSIERSDLFVSCLPGLETSLVRELKSLGVEGVGSGKAGALVADSDLFTACKICYLSRLSLRVLWKIHKIRLWKQQNLYQQAIKQPWELWLGKPAKTFRIATSGKSALFPNSLFALQRFKDAVCDRYRAADQERPQIEKENPEIRLHLHLEEEALSFYIDMSGEPLNQRGYRFESVPAPLNEVAAASLLYLAGYDGFRPFCDPCAGSGTLLLEAAMIAANLPAGKWRKKWGFQHHPKFDPLLFEKWKEQQDLQSKALRPGWIVGCEEDPQAFSALKTNLRRLPTLRDSLFFGPFQKALLPDRYVVVTNPPYGKRLHPKENLYKDLGLFLSKYASRAFLLGPEPDRIEATGLPILQQLSLLLSGVECFFVKVKTSPPKRREEKATL